MILDDCTNYDIGEPFLSVKYPNGTIAHTSNGIVVNTDSGIRYTCSYKRLVSMLSKNSKHIGEFLEETNVLDIADKFNQFVNAKMTEINNINKQLNALYNANKRTNKTAE